jgi:hypothetical protein
MDLQAYTRKFRAEVHKLAYEDYSDSFSPGDVIPRPKKPVVMPITWYREKAHLLTQMLADQGHPEPKGFNALDAVLETLFEHGDSPSMKTNPVLSANPDTPNIPKEVFEALDYYNLLPSEAVKLQFRGAVGSLVDIYLKIQMGLVKQDFKIQGEGEEKNRVATINQYRRYIASEIVLEVVRLAFEVTPSEVDHLLINTGAGAMSTPQLKDSATRKTFWLGIGRLVRSLFGNQRLGAELVSKALK